MNPRGEPVGFAVSFESARSGTRPDPQRLKPWKLNKVIYRQRDHRRLNGFRRIFTRYDKPNVLSRSFITFALIWLTLV